MKKVIVVKSSTGMGSHYWTHCPRCGTYIAWAGRFHYCPKCHELFDKIADALDMEVLTCVTHHPRKSRDKMDNILAGLKSSDKPWSKIVMGLQHLIVHLSKRFTV